MLAGGLDHRRGPMTGSPPHGSRWRIVISTVITVAVLVVVFLGIFPKVANSSEAWASIQQMPTAYLVALVVATVVNILVYVWPLQAALPGLRYGPGFVVRQTSFAISNAVPAGGGEVTIRGNCRHACPAVKSP